MIARDAQSAHWRRSRRQSKNLRPLSRWRFERRKFGGPNRTAFEPRNSKRNQMPAHEAIARPRPFSPPGAYRRRGHMAWPSCIATTSPSQAIHRRERRVGHQGPLQSRFPLIVQSTSERRPVSKSQDFSLCGAPRGAPTRVLCSSLHQSDHR